MMLGDLDLRPRMEELWRWLSESLAMRSCLKWVDDATRRNPAGGARGRRSSIGAYDRNWLYPSERPMVNVPAAKDSMLGWLIYE
jgi:hypothetical protein